MSYSRKSIRQEERKGIRDFLSDNKKFLFNVLDFGAGDQPYRDLCRDYIPYEKGQNLPDTKFDCLLMTQVVQYLPNPYIELEFLKTRLNEGGYLVMTYPVHWEEVDDDDYWRFTKKGMEFLLRDWQIIKHEPLHKLEFEDFELVTNYGLVARKN